MRDPTSETRHSSAKNCPPTIKQLTRHHRHRLMNRFLARFTMSIKGPTRFGCFWKIFSFSCWAQVRSSREIQWKCNEFDIRVISVGCTFIVGVIIVIPICMIFFGAIYMHECPLNKYIPIYLLIGGIMGIIKPILSLSLHVRATQQEQAEERQRQSGTQSTLNWFILAWFMIGSYWIYHIYEPNYDSSKGKYCNKSLYTFAFWLVTSAYIGCGAIFLIMLLLTILSVVLRSKAMHVSVVNVWSSFNSF